MRVFFDALIYRLEKGRRWGLVCKCCSHLRHEGPVFKPSKCDHASRRLKEARKFYFTMCDEMARYGRSFTFEDCENDEWVFRVISFATRGTEVEMRSKGKWLKVTPWLMSEAEDPEQARCVLDQLQNADESRMSPLEIRYKYDLSASLEVVFMLYESKAL